MFLRARPTDEVANDVLDEFNNVDGIKDVVGGILALQQSKVYEEFVFGRGNDPRLSSEDFDELSELIRLASENMSKFPLSIPFAPLITAKLVMVTYTVVYDLYSIRLGRDFTSDELYNIFYGSMTTRILLMLEDFDSEEETPQPTAGFFKKLGTVKWKDKKAKKLYNHIHGIVFMLMHNKWKGTKGPSSTFRITEHAFILLLSGCSAVLGGRDKINMDDVIRANKTYLKLINTDFSGLV
ncbi:MAG TPA: hypothetical protein PL168_09475 [Methanobacterium sp.]|mgnify:CR=1 FL=1|jgi:hypothetical protein|nr:hypothetical protein [Methanobacterium sp.]HOI40947.1 hypothetical protein [Methanobacterium sp.]